jgi:hypothetical protein
VFYACNAKQGADAATELRRRAATGGATNTTPIPPTVESLLPLDDKDSNGGLTLTLWQIVLLAIVFFIIGRIVS